MFNLDSLKPEHTLVLSRLYLDPSVSFDEFVSAGLQKHVEELTSSGYLVRSTSPEGQPAHQANYSLSDEARKLIQDRLELSLQNFREMFLKNP